jgi:hypothetical protein
MELQEFIRTALVSIVRGVESAQAELKSSKATINPEGIRAQLALEQLKESPAFTNVEFEVAVEVKNSSDQGGSAGIKVAVFSMGVSGKNNNSASHLSRLKFNVPVHLPPGAVLKLDQQ